MDMEFNINKAISSILTTTLLSSILFSLIFFSNNKISRYFDIHPYFELFSVVVFIIILFLLLFRIFSFFQRKLKIIATENFLLIPNIYLGVKKILIKELFSVEYLVVMGKNVGIVLGVKNNSRYIIDKSIFISDKDFEEYFKYIKKEVSRSNEIEILEVFENLSKSQVVNKSKSLNILALILLFCYLISLVSTFEFSPSEDFLLLAANTKEIFMDLEVYRIFTSFFFHTRPYHLLLNIVVLGLLGPVIEKTFSIIRFINIILISNIVAVFSSNYFSYFDASIGSSGGVFGLWGAFAFLKFRYEKYLPGSVNLLPTGRLLTLLLGELFLEIFWLENVDYFAHIGGFIAGFVYLYFAPLGPKLEYVDQPTLIEKNLSVILISSYSA